MGDPVWLGRTHLAADKVGVVGGRKRLEIRLDVLDLLRRGLGLGGRCGLGSGRIDLGGRSGSLNRRRLVQFFTHCGKV